MVMAWRFGAVDVQSVMAVLEDPAQYPDWMIGVPEAVRADHRWPAVGSILSRDDGQEVRGRHMYNRHLTVAIVELYRPEAELVCRVRSGLGGWIRLAVEVQSRPGGCLVEVRADPLTPTARLRFTGPARTQAEGRCAVVAERLITLAT